MKTANKFSKTILIAIVLLAFSYLSNICISQTHNCSYQLLDHPGGSTYHRLNVAVSESLYEYYLGKTHGLNSNTDFAKFVTPYALKPIADTLTQIYTDDEDYTNGVLMIVHQIPYEATTPAKYPVETIVDNKGDCDLFSYIAASVLEAHGIDSVLLYYETEAHMNIGVSLSHPPQDARRQAYYVTYNSVRYYVAECTGGNWQEGWRVGECPDDLKQASVQVITLENCESTAPGQVSASLQTLQTSIISLTISPGYLLQGSTVTISGQLSPALRDKTVTIYLKASSLSWTTLTTVTTDSNGQFTCTWNAETSGICYIRASWSGDNEYSAADSQTLTITVLSMFFILLLGITIMLVCVGTFAFIASRQTQQRVPEPQPPEAPY